MGTIKVSVLEQDGAELDVPTEMDLLGALDYVGAANGVGTPNLLGWNDIVADINIKGSGTNSPSWTLFRNGLYAYSFSANTMQECWLSFHFRHDYALNTAIFPHIHFAVNTTSTGVVRFGIEYSIAKGYDQGVPSTFGATQTVYIEYNISSNSQYKHLIAEVITGITDANLEVDSVMLCRVFRDAANAADTHPSPVFILNCDVHYQVDRTSTKNRNPDFYV